MRLINTKDIDLIKSISNLSISPDGNMLAFCLESTCLEKNVYNSILCSYELNGCKLHYLTTNIQICDYCFDQNGLLLYTCKTENEKKQINGRTEVWRVDPISGLSEIAFILPVSDAQIDLFSGDSFIVCAPWDLELEKLKAIGDEQAIGAHLRQEVIVCDEYPYRVDGQGYVNKKRKRIYQYSCGENILKSITPTTFQQCDYAIDGDKLYVLGEDYEVKSSQRQSVYCWDGSTFTLSAVGNYSFSALAASNNKIYVSTDVLANEADSYIYAAKEGDTELTVEIKTRYALFNNISTDITSGSGCEFRAFNKQLYYTMQNRKGVFLYRYEDNCETRISPDGVDILQFTISKDGRIFASGLPEFGSAEIFEIYPDRVVQLTSFNETELGEFEFIRPEHLEFTSSDLCKIDGWVVPPVNYQPGEKYPAILNIHGGPQLRYYGGLNFSHQLWASRGYYVMYCNPHGSIGDTADFSNIRQKYGTIDYEDIMLFVDTVLGKYPEIDEKRMGVTGISYGGFMTNWIITRNHRFAAAASQSGISDWISLHATDDLPGFDLTITGSLPWESIVEHWRISPLAYAGECSTPTLFIECSEDYRCSVDQGLGMYQALIEMEVPTRTIIVNGESHCVFRLGKPINRIRIFNEITDWFEKYIPKG